jgi:hypothetical protein
MDTPADDPAAAATARADDPAPKAPHVRRSIPPSIVTFFYAPLIVMPPQSTAARKIQAIHRGRLARKDYSMLKRVQQRTAYKQYISSDTLRHRKVQLYYIVKMGVQRPKLQVYYPRHS